MWIQEPNYFQEQTGINNGPSSSNNDDPAPPNAALHAPTLPPRPWSDFSSNPLSGEDQASTSGTTAEHSKSHLPLPPLRHVLEQTDIMYTANSSPGSSSSDIIPLD